MGIIFKEDRELVSSGRVEAGKVYGTFSPEDEQAFVDNLVADFASAEPGKKKPAAEGGA